ncbi:hypothetical protein E2C01_040594 [Portunus trituberculatus]|uniref:Uncharacterized protein n=1 Tax=Portunus trituberculatus TaxID=210409 RepID=A0A5B7FR73_PORTR|nr:hypothetical protein [Portunus trituberculatus]
MVAKPQPSIHLHSKYLDIFLEWERAVPKINIAAFVAGDLEITIACVFPRADVTLPVSTLLLYHS